MVHILKNHAPLSTVTISIVTIAVLIAALWVISGSPVATVSAAPPIELITNGSFETGNFVGWTTVTTGSPFRPWAVSGAGAGDGFGIASTSPQDGTQVAWNGFDGIGPMQFSMYQDVSIPAGKAALSWQERIQWNFGLGGFASQPRTYDVEIRNPLDNSVLTNLFSFSTGTQAQNVTGDTGWQSHSVDISSFAGSTVRIHFLENIPETSTGPAQIEFDQISLIAIPNGPPDCSQAGPSVASLWPPNHEFKAINVNGVTDPDGDAVVIKIDGITQDEPVNGLGDGDTSPDGQGVGSDTADVRAERSGDGNGRVYVIAYTADDGNGGTCSGTAEVGVPHDKKDTALNDGATIDSTVS